jgi:hypothetical protein
VEYSARGFYLFFIFPIQLSQNLTYECVFSQRGTIIYRCKYQDLYPDLSVGWKNLPTITTMWKNLPGAPEKYLRYEGEQVFRVVKKKIALEKDQAPK